jgi:hypothetical protein
LISVKMPDFSHFRLKRFKAFSRLSSSRTLISGIESSPRFRHLVLTPRHLEQRKTSTLDFASDAVKPSGHSVI